ncbi:hypothetical protein [Nocardia coubleae]|uniref:Uncharacterized protein n=1 Tax=Nocardia coubleae TaxID=356147 RepID=A0A846W7G4_9NOCA|nr:hypothetical protein [Nocardia coubleae]NKX89171.1 hypothetical protein [Nocardia coubleae]
MDLDAYTRRAQELAVILDVRKPRVKRGKVSEKVLPEGIWIRTVVLRPWIALTPQFDTLSEAERDSELAAAVTYSHLTESGMPKFVAIVTLLPLPFACLTGYVAGALDVSQLGFNLLLALFLALWTCMYLTGAFLWAHRMFFQTDRKIAETFGASWATTNIQLSRRMRYKRRGIFGLYLSLSMPSEQRRLQAIADLSTLDSQGVRAHSEPV